MSSMGIMGPPQVKHNAGVDKIRAYSIHRLQFFFLRTPELKYQTQK